MGKTKQNGILYKLRRGIMCGVLSCVLALGAVLTMPGMGMTAKAAGTHYEKGIGYVLNDAEHTASVAGCNPYEIGEEVHIPAIIKEGNQNYKVVRISGLAFNFCDKIKKLILEEGIEEIDYVAFCGCSGITEIEIPITIPHFRQERITRN